MALCFVSLKPLNIGSNPGLLRLLGHYHYICTLLNVALLILIHSSNRHLKSDVFRLTRNCKFYDAPFFKFIPDAKYDSLAKLCVIQRANENEVIFHQGKSSKTHLKKHLLHYLNNIISFSFVQAMRAPSFLSSSGANVKSPLIKITNLWT